MPSIDNKNRSNRFNLKKLFSNIGAGICMGAADIVPGVSGGTMAFILGIYQELIDSIKLIDSTTIRLLLKLKFKEVFNYIPWQFLASLFFGMLLSVVTLSQFIEDQLSSNPTVIWSFFFGLVLASVVTILKAINNWSTTIIILIMISSVVSYAIVGAAPQNTPNTAWFIFLSGAIAINAMILPGISGAYILVLFGIYKYILSAVNSRDFVTLTIFLIGASIGLATFVRMLSWLLQKHRNICMSVLTGLMIGSLRKLWPWQSTNTPTHPILPSSMSYETITVIGIISIGISMVLLLHKISNNKKET